MLVVIFLFQLLLFAFAGSTGFKRDDEQPGAQRTSTWDFLEIFGEQGVGMGQDTRARGYFAIEGPGMDFYRVPLNGRNFEYMTGEDPYLGSQLAPAEIKGIQSQGVWACAKHFVCNDEEENRTNVHIVVDERTLREIYLPPFEASVKVGHAATVIAPPTGFGSY